MGIIRVTLLSSLCLALAAGCGGKGTSTGDADAGPDATDPVLDLTDEADVEPDPGLDPATEPATDPLEDSVEDPAEDPLTDPVEDPAEDPAEDPTEDPAEDPATDPVTDPITDPGTETSCVGMGCPTSSMGLACCSGLTLETGCEPGVTCSTSYCVDCGDGACHAPESAWACHTDCPTGCTAGTVETTVCPGTGTVQCTCVEDPCKPYCDLDGVAPDGWIDGCTGTSLGTCTDVTATPVCRLIGTRSEGWYESGSGGSFRLIDWDFCANRWSCVVL